jgi:hypothetical protein
MIKKMIVLLQLATALILGALIVWQVGLTPEKARHIDRKDPLWFMAPWRPDTAQGPSGAAAPEGPQQARDKTVKAVAIRRSILAPSPALDAMIANLESKDLEAAGPVLIPAECAPGQPEVRKKVKPAADPRKKPAAAGPVRITSLRVTATAHGVQVKGLTSAPVERMALYTFASPPRMILELYGTFDPYGQPIAVPANPIIQSVTTEVTGDKLRIIGTLLTDKAAVAPVTRASSRDAFAVELTLGPGDQPGGPPSP